VRVAAHGFTFRLVPAKPFGLVVVDRVDCVCSICAPFGQVTEFEAASVARRHLGLLRYGCASAFQAKCPRVGGCCCPLRLPPSDPAVARVADLRPALSS